MQVGPSVPDVDERALLIGLHREPMYRQAGSINTMHKYTYKSQRSNQTDQWCAIFSSATARGV
mgnify:CR=1 FL=1